MTKPQYKVFEKLQKRQVNREDAVVVEVSESCCTMFIAFPGLYLTYDKLGRLIETETTAERKMTTRPLAVIRRQIGGQRTFGLDLDSEMG